MKRTFTVGGSLAFNVVLLSALAFRPSLAPPVICDFIVQHIVAPRTPAPAKPVVIAPAPRKQLWPALDMTGDLAVVVTRLRKAGFPADVIRALVSAEINRRYLARNRALTEPDPNAPFWKTQPSFGMSSKSMEEYYQLSRERSKLLRDLFNDPFFASDEVTSEQRRQFGGLSHQKIDAVQRIEDDYSEMGSQIRAAMNGVILPEDRAKLELLEREKQADLASVLSPEELADYQLRSSPTSRLLARQLGGFDPTEAEFRAIFGAQRAFSEKVLVGVGGVMDLGAVTPEAREAAQAQLVEQLKSALGPTRYADYTRETDRGFQQLVMLAKRENLPSDSAVRAYSMGDTVARESNRIYDDSTLSMEQKTAALQALAQTTRNNLTAILGPTAGATYIASVNQRWLNRVEQGAAVTFTDRPTNTIVTSSNGSGSGMITFGNSVEFRMLPPSAKPSP
jgi:hypothetical protein